ncbi:MAG: hypothetical protein EXS64_08075 [Candidatus Latescibacteria bacterium]|nr:hypothetical protein [Candidatus Latescibacterota bacterium]
MDQKFSSPLLAGYACADITPAIGDAWGIGKQVREIAVPLTARVVYLEEPDGEGPVLLAMADHTGFTRQSDRRMRNAIAQALDLSPLRVRINVTHNHTAPDADQTVQELLAPFDLHHVSLPWLDRMEAALRARASRRPVTVHAGLAPVERLSSNRSVRRPDGTIATRFGVASPELQAAPEGLIDPDVGVLSLRGEDGRPVVTLLNYACHVTSLKGRGEVIHPDFPHYALEIVERETGGPGFFLQGAAGNVGPGKYADGSVEGAQVLGARLAEGALAALGRLPPCAPAPLRLESWEETVSLDPELPSSDEARAQLAEAARSDRGTETWRRAAMLQVVADPEAARRPELFLLRGGDWCLAGLPAESFAEFGLSIRAASPTPFTLVGAYYDCTLWYIPTYKSFRDGGYESRGGWRYVAPGAGEQITASVIRRLCAAPLHP